MKNFKKGDLVYVDLKKEFPPICAISKYCGDLEVNGGGFDIDLDIIETQHHGIVYVDRSASTLIAFKG